jgi:hypothetical protein
MVLVTLLPSLRAQHGPLISNPAMRDRARKRDSLPTFSGISLSSLVRMQFLIGTNAIDVPALSDASQVWPASQRSTSWR